MIPNATKSQPLTADEVQKLIDRTGKSKAWCARMIGITPVQLTYITKGKHSCSYPIQFALECLAYACEQIEQLK